MRTHDVVVPTTTIVQEETCFDLGKKPFPVSYAQQRRQKLFTVCISVEIAEPPFPPNFVMRQAPMAGTGPTLITATSLLVTVFGFSLRKDD